MVSTCADPPQHSYPRVVNELQPHGGHLGYVSAISGDPKTPDIHPTQAGQHARDADRQSDSKELSALSLGSVWPCVETNLSACHLTEEPQWRDPQAGSECHLCLSLSPFPGMASAFVSESAFSGDTHLRTNLKELSRKSKPNTPPFRQNQGRDVTGLKAVLQSSCAMLG